MAEFDWKALRDIPFRLSFNDAVNAEHNSPLVTTRTHTKYPFPSIYSIVFFAFTIYVIYIKHIKFLPMNTYYLKTLRNNHRCSF